MDFIHAHLHQRWFASGRRPSLQVSQVDCPHRARRQTESQRHLAGRGTLTRLPNGVLEALAEWRLARQLQHLLDLDAAVRAAHPINLHHHRRTELHARKIAHFPFTHIVRVLQLATTSRTHQLPIAALPPDPQFQGLRPLIDFMPVDSITRPSQQFGQFAVSQTAECTEIASLAKATPACGLSDSCSEPFFGGQWLRIDAKYPIAEKGRITSYAVVLSKPDRKSVVQGK